MASEELGRLPSGCSKGHRDFYREIINARQETGTGSWVSKEHLVEISKSLCF